MLTRGFHSRKLGRYSISLKAEYAVFFKAIREEDYKRRELPYPGSSPKQSEVNDEYNYIHYNLVTSRCQVKELKLWEVTN